MRGGLRDRCIRRPHGERACRIERVQGLILAAQHVRHVDDTAFVGTDHTAFDQVLQFTDVAGKAIVQQCLHRARREAQHGTTVQCGIAAQEVVHQERNVFPTLAQRRQVNGEDLEPEVAVAGDSAGGTLAAVAALLAREQGGPALRYQSLVYPMTAASPGEYPSYAQYGEGHVLSARAARYFMHHYTNGGVVERDFRFAPLLADDLADLPPTLMMLGGNDILHDEGLAYAQRLLAAGVHVTLVDYLALGHGFISMGGALDAARLAIDQLAGALGRALAS